MLAPPEPAPHRPLNSQVVSEVKPAGDFYLAEDYHQQVRRPLQLSFITRPYDQMQTDKGNVLRAQVQTRRLWVGCVRGGCKVPSFILPSVPPSPHPPRAAVSEQRREAGAAAVGGERLQGPH